MSAGPSRRGALQTLAGLSLGALTSCGGVTAPTVGYAAGSPKTPTGFGAQIYTSDGVMRDIALLKALGAKYVRISVQPNYLAFIDAAVSAATQAGLRVILLSDYAKQPVNVAAYAAATAQLHLRYAASNPIWEIWNEPNLPQYWNAPPDVTAYVALLLATAQALRAAGAIDVWTGGTSGVDLNWIYNLTIQGAFGAANGCAVHSYKAPGFARTEYLQAVSLVPSGVAIHTTETCVPSSSDQASFFAQMWSIHRELGLPTMIWCEFRDGGAGTVPPYNEAYGLVTSSYAPKAVYAAARNAISTQE